MSWPTLIDYQSAIQNPKLCFQDYDLRVGNPQPDSLGLPKPISGNFAVVFSIKSNNTRWAVRCFIKQQGDRDKRYDLISRYLEKVKLPYIVDFKFATQGIRINSNWYPIIKMKWIDGELLDSYVARNVNNPQVIARLADNFARMVSVLKQHNIAHGDLQHRNILIENNDIRLVDYDGMYVPGLENLGGCEFGHFNYQSPLRNENDFGPYLDDFSAWSIYLSLTALSISPEILKSKTKDDEALFFTKQDYEYPDLSEKFNLLRQIPNNDVQKMTFFLKCICSIETSKIPSFDPKQVPNLTLSTPKGIFVKNHKH